MTVPTSNNREEYEGNGAATAFDYAFKVFRADDLVAVLTASDGTETTLTRGTDYSVDGVGEEAGGTVTYPLSGDPLATGETLTILREIPVVQETDLRNQGRYYPETLEDEFDRSRMIDQQQQEQLDRTLSRTRASDYFDAKGRRIANVGDAVEDQDAYTKGQADARFANDVITQTGGQWDAKGKRLTHLQDPVADDDAATKQSAAAYTDAEVAEEATQRQQADANLQRQISGGDPLEASAFSPISWHDQTIENSVEIPANKNAWSFGPSMTIAAGQTVTVGDNAFWTIANGEVTA